MNQASGRKLMVLSGDQELRQCVQHNGELSRGRLARTENDLSIGGLLSEEDG